MLRVLEVLDAENIRLNPFIAQMITSLEDAGVEVRYWSLSAALAKNLDVVHVHWPERLYRGSTKTRCLAKVLLLAAILILWKIRRIPIIWTVHNLTPHEGLNRIEKTADYLFRRSVTLAVYLNDYEDDVPGLNKRAKRAVIKHGDYVEWMAEYPQMSSRPNQICLFGNLRPYKGIESLIQVGKSLPQEYTLLIAGKPHESSYGQSLRRLIGLDRRIILDDQFQSDADLVTAITSSVLTVLPYRNFYNSGAVFLSLSLNRPVLVPKNPHTELLQQEFGSEWISLYTGELTENDVKEAAVNSSQIDKRTVPDFTERQWKLLGCQYVDKMKSLVA